jgi:hypothetical protein
MNTARAYASWPIALWHGLGTGTDARLPWLLALDGLCVLAVAGALSWRARLRPAGILRAVALTSTIVVPLATTIFAVTSLSGPRLTAALHRPGGGTEEVRLSLAIHGRRAFGRMLLQPGEASRGMNNDD